jgi:hypothetical protein
MSLKLKYNLITYFIVINVWCVLEIVCNDFEWAAPNNADCTKLAFYLHCSGRLPESDLCLLGEYAVKLLNLYELTLLRSVRFYCYTF